MNVEQTDHRTARPLERTPAASANAHRPRRRESSAVGRRDALRSALQQASYEILPFKTAEEKVVAHVPQHLPLSVTTTEAKGLGPTVELAVRLRRHGYTVAPHLAARLVRDEVHVADLVSQLQEAGVDRIFVIGGDAPEPIGRFADAHSLLLALERTDHRFSEIGIGGYPEGHGLVAPDLIEEALVKKAEHATGIVTQLCFDAAATTAWASALQERGVRLPIRVGIPGAINRQRLIRVSAGLGLGQSARFLAKQRSMFWRFFLPRGYSPQRLVERLAPALERADNQLAGFHVFTFNELEGTEAWRQRWLERLG